LEYSVPYGKNQNIVIQIPERVRTICYESPLLSPANDPVEIIADAIEHPIDSAPLHDLVKTSDRVCIVCDDISRPTPCDIILPVLLKKLNCIGVPDINIQIVIALGSHRPMTRDEVIQKVGESVFSRITVANSSFNNDSDLVEVGETDEGVKIWVNRIVYESDFLIGIGNVTPHPVMGWSGGAKILFPGVTGERTVEQFHMLGGLQDRNLYGLDDSPIRHIIENWTNRIGLDFIINTVLTRDFEIYEIFAGHFISAHRKCVEHAKTSYGSQILELADIVITSSFPSDADLWQSTKAYFSAEIAAKGVGSTIVLVAPNFEGIGPHKEYVDYFGDDDSHVLLSNAFTNNEFRGDLLALSVGTSMSKLRKRKKLAIVSDGINASDACKCKIKYYPVKDLQTAVDELINLYENPVVAIIRNGGDILLKEK